MVQSKLSFPDWLKQTFWFPSNPHLRLPVIFNTSARVPPVIEECNICTWNASMRIEWSLNSIHSFVNHITFCILKNFIRHRPHNPCVNVTSSRARCVLFIPHVNSKRIWNAWNSNEKSTTLSSSSSSSSSSSLDWSN